MFGTLAYCLGFTSNGLTPSDKSKGLSFRTEELNDDWTLVDLNDQSCGKVEVSEYPTPPPSPPLEHSWLITPPPCFNPEVDQPVIELNPMENLLIEHPSMFLSRPMHSLRSNKKSSPTQSLVESSLNREKIQKSTQRKCEKNPSCCRHSRRRKGPRQASTIMCYGNRRNVLSSNIRRCNREVSKRNNARLRQMRQLIQQPRKRC